ncbi:MULTISPECIES: isoprenyl transferase [Paenibacillus]|jgi:undecaprenyl diphosphate synthase|uniref:Isoprenyl transferase n=2 Tax=Paenibacillus barengoltzii TaxID=343517 RepID=R9LD45_9BACL|nr:MULTISPECIES: isoprenyl transferase [Paenibacillus]EOS56704.1 di-trans,poly-cis-decaprenylcistransferase [Paenibacillus barengoltzii G22]MCT2197441.1 isoprenyl transferase [Paenibacillus sp. p3-SID1389]MDU0329293.1 isoprenyl transferase [Paenibacillus sp. 3LSP]MEC2345627.1 isoprenyl transferase [Paenibacillus barengoltzii]SME93013.1 undecaprenyl diphosphate synthase [Paenibacillus barengoltzii]
MIKLFQPWRKKKNPGASVSLSPDNIPKHVAIIMDGNGRWARRLGMPRIVGHRSGMKAVKRATIAADELGISILTLYAFSTENWKRPKDEVDYLMSLPQEFLAIELDELVEKNVQVRMMGHTDELPAHTIAAMEEAIERTKHNTGLILNFALNYGSRREITESVKGIAKAVQSGELSVEDITPETIESRLLSAGLPDPDLLIRTSGELRLSNFMLWQTAYSELWFTDILWPDFSKEHLVQAVAEYQRRTRRYGGLT